MRSKAPDITTSERLGWLGREVKVKIETKQVC